MEIQFNCPCCKANNWCMVQKHHFDQTSKKSENNRTGYTENYLSKRFEILFKVWFAGHKKVVLTTMYCNSCGFMCYSPRPNQDDLQAKYEYLSKRGNIGILSNPTQRALKLDRRRELFMKKMITKHHAIRSQKVLDVGGGDGRLLRPFLEEDCSCSLVDFNPKSYPGVHRVGSTLEDIPGGNLFDILICSHVLEHVDDPSKFLRQLRSRLSDKGVVYLEVPLEIWGDIPIDIDPVTHINFFTVHSLKNALLLNGLEPLSIKSKFSPYDGRYKRVAWVVAAAAGIETSFSSVNSIATINLVTPGSLKKLNRVVENSWLKLLNLPLTINKKLKPATPQI